MDTSFFWEMEDVVHWVDNWKSIMKYERGRPNLLEICASATIVFDFGPIVIGTVEQNKAKLGGGLHHSVAVRKSWLKMKSNR